MKAIIIDDEEMALKVLSIMIENLKEFEISLQGAFKNVEDALRLLEQTPVDLIFLDMEMVTSHGLQVAQYLLIHYPNVQIIFVTAHSQFAVDAFELEVTDYLLKPVSPSRLVKAIAKAKKNLELDKQHTADNTLYAHTMGNFYLLNKSQEVIKWRTKKVRELFLYLWLNQPKPMLNATIVDVLWPETEYEKALTNLHTATYHLRQLFKKNDIENSIQFANNHYMLTVNIKSDYEKLNALLAKHTYQEKDIEQILELYVSDFLESEEFQWAFSIQSQLRQRTLHVLETFISNKSATNTLLIHSVLQKMLELDGYNEHYMLLLMRFLVEQNKKVECIQLYELIKERLEEELNIPIPGEIKKIFLFHTT